MAYTKDELEKQWPKRLEKLKTLYQWEYVSSHGPRGKGMPWTEIVAERLIAPRQLDRFSEIEPLKSKHYNIPKHLDPCPSGEGAMPLREKQVVKWMVGKKDLGVLGTAQNYEAPLVDGGKQNIDLITAKDDELVLVEVKKENNTESLLRAILEIVTYGHLVDKEQLRREFRMGDSKITLAVLIHPNSNSGKELKELIEKSPRRKNLCKLIQTLNVEIYTFETTDSEKAQLKIRKAWPC